MEQATCIVVYGDGTPCPHPPYGRSAWCLNCYTWSRKYGRDPQGRRRVRSHNTLVRDIRALSRRDTDECVILPGYKVRPKATFQGKQMAASRIAWWLEHGDPGDLWVLHTCHRGEEGCVNLRHLYLGDVQQNHRDMNEAGRHGLPGAKIGAREAEEIRRRYVKGNRFRPGNRLALAEEFGITERTVRRIVRGEHWAGA